MKDVPQTPASTAARPTVMFVDDEERVLRSLRMVFAPHYNVHVATSGHKALALLKREKVHALVSDQRMPVMTGVELLRRAKEISPNTVRLLLTGYSDSEAVMGSINEGEIFRFIAKPWTLSKLRDTIKSAVEIAVGLERQAPADGSAAPCAEDLGCILLIDEDPQTANALRAIVEQAHPGKLTVEWAANADALFHILGRARVAMVISDVRLGEMDITDLLKALKRHDPAMVTVIQSSVADSGIMVELINEAHIHRFLLKPLRGGMALRAIETGLERRRAHLALPKPVAQQSAGPASAAPDVSPMQRILSMFRGLMAGRKA